ncbi:EAL domain-containing protein [Lentibacillus sp. N15]|uniref:EAL domain-containing protein n=1 Tax=Lentibacillus songyuanensis TaxID=3136161 RepID=UPI0031BB9D02
MTNSTPKRTNFLRQLFQKTKDDSHTGRCGEQNLLPNESVLLNYYQSLAMNHPDLILVLSPEGEILSQNRSSINELLGFPVHKKLIFNKLVATDIYNKLATTFYQALAGNTERHDIKIKHRQGHMLQLVLTFIPITVAKQTTEGVYLIIKNITEYKQVVQALEVSEQHLCHAQQIANIGSWEYVIDDNQLICSDNFYRLFGIQRTEHMPMEKPFELVHPDDYEQTWNLVNQATDIGTSYATSFRFYHGQTKELRHMKVQADTTWKDNKPFKLVGVIRDDTNERQNENKLNDTIHRFRYIFDHLEAAVWLKDVVPDAHTFISKGTEQIYQYPLQRLYDDPTFWEASIHEEDRAEVQRKQQLLARGKVLNHEYRIHCGDGSIKWVYDQTVPWMNQVDELVSIFGVQIDITDQMKLREQLDYHATNDPLTSLPNQRSLYHKLDKLCDQQRPGTFALLYLDLDNFTQINHALGYQTGDEALIQVTNRLQAMMPNNSFLSRVSGNDFVIIIQNYPSEKDIIDFAESIINHVSASLDVKGYELHITASIGISFFPKNGDDKLTVMESAYSALYQAKQLGKNNFQLYSFTKDISSYKRYLLEKDLRQAIKLEEFELYYQPKVNTKTGFIEGAEALIRWHHDEWGLVSPGEFIPIAEENHLIQELGDWVIKTVCRQLREWKDRDYTLRPISINISPIRFLKKGLAETIQHYLEHFQIPAKYLELEITEGFLLKTEQRVLTTLAELREMGVSIAIDDFGTGFASLEYLHEFQADTLKIDRLFINHTHEANHKDAAIVAAVLHLAKGLGMKTVAEGVEEYGQYEFLLQKECDVIQGFLFSKPVRVTEFEQMMQAGTLKPLKRKLSQQSEVERREYFRFTFPYYLKAKMRITEVNHKKVNLGYAAILIENISLGGIKILSPLRLPVNTAITFNFQLSLMNALFDVDGKLLWKNEGKADTFFYGIALTMGEKDKNRLAGILNKMTVLKKLNQEIPDTNFLKENPYAYLHNHPL